MSPTERRSSPRYAARRLVALRCLEDGKPTWTGFASTVDMSTGGALLELPDRMHVGQSLSLEFLLDENKIARVDGTVTRVTHTKKVYHIAVKFEKLTPQTKRLLAKA